MYLKKGMICFALVFMFVVLCISQTAPRYSDDRELFIGVAGSGVMPNIMILADNSITMKTAIYHPDYDPALYYNHSDPSDVTSETLSLDCDGYQSLSSTKTFNICGDKGIYVLHSDYSATFNSAANKIWTITAISGTWTKANVVGKTVEWGCTNTPNSCTRSTTITDVTSTSPLKIVINPKPSRNPSSGSIIYINAHWELSSSNPNTRGFTPEGTTCESAGYTNTIASNVMLYGVATDGGVTYDDNYLYWLAFHADDTQIAEVTHWATTGAFKHDSSGGHINAGYYRMQVTKDVLKDVLTELWTKNDAYNFGLADFDSGSAGAQILNNLQNATNLEGSLTTFRNSIDSMDPNTYTPLAEALADIWAYFKDGGGPSSWNYQPESLTNPPTGGCGRVLESGFPPASCPIQYPCQKNYVIIMTDGQSTRDNFSDSKYDGAIFRNPVNGVDGVGAWGDGDNHDPATYDGAQPTTFSPAYCPQSTCFRADINGTDFLDDVAWYINHNDIFPNTPDNIRPDMPGIQNIETFTIGFSVDNEILKETAKNGNGEYYTAGDYTALKAALSSAITNIMLRNFAFASYTAPKRVTTAVGEGASFVGYFMPSDKEVWDGHLQSYTMFDKWFADADGSGGLSPEEQTGEAYGMKTTCQSITGKTCLQVVEMARTPNWDAADKLSSLTSDRNLYFLDYSSGTPTPANFTLAANIDTLQGPFGFDLPADDPAAADPLLYHNQALAIVSEISSKLYFGDVFHSDIAYVGAPLKGKIYLQNYNPPECDLSAVDGSGNPTDADCYQTFRLAHGDRRKVAYVGTNIGIVHMIDANTPDSADPATADGGKEIWGFIPDEILPTLKTIALDKKFAYTADGRITADDIYVHGATSDPWKTILTFGLKDGGQSFYALDITHVPTATEPSKIPIFLWKFKDANYSGNSWSKPIIGKIRYSDGSSSYDRWVVIVTGGRAFNNENPDDSKGKAVFVLDAATGDVIWMIGYNSASGADDVTTTPEMEVNKLAYANPSGHPSGEMHLTRDAAFNYCIPSAISAIDRDNNGYIDSIYFGNVAGNMFKINIANASPTNWKAYSIYKTDLSTLVGSGQIDVITPGTPANTYQITLLSGALSVGSNVIGRSSTHPMGFITEPPEKSGSNWLYKIQETSDASFSVNEIIDVKPYDPIFLAPAIYTDSCNNYWVNFGTGDRLRSRTNTASGKFVSVKDGGSTPMNLTKSNLVALTFSSTTNAFSGSTNLKVADKWGWYFDFPDSANGEKLFDPDPIILPDQNFLPTIYFNTYQYDPSATASTDCNAPSSGAMRFYQIAVDYCGTGTASGQREEGRISGGGMMEGSEFIIVEGTSEVGSVDLPGLGSPPKFLPKPMPYTGGLLFWKEKKR